MWDFIEDTFHTVLTTGEKFKDKKMFWKWILLIVSFAIVYIIFNIIL